MKSLKDGLSRRFDILSQTISVDTEMDNMRGSHRGKERIKSNLCLTRISTGKAEDGKAALEREWWSVIQKRLMGQMQRKHTHLLKKHLVSA